MHHLISLPKKGGQCPGMSSVAPGALAASPSSSQGFLPLIISQSTTPKLKISTAVVYPSPSLSSGALQRKETGCVALLVIISPDSELPKSARRPIFRSPPSSRRIFGVFMSVDGENLSESIHSIWVSQRTSMYDWWIHTVQVDECAGDVFCYRLSKGRPSC